MKKNPDNLALWYRKYKPYQRCLSKWSWFLSTISIALLHGTHWRGLAIKCCCCSQLIRSRTGPFDNLVTSMRFISIPFKKQFTIRYLKPRQWKGTFRVTWCYNIWGLCFSCYLRVPVRSFWFLPQKQDTVIGKKISEAKEFFMLSLSFIHDGFGNVNK